MYPRLGTPALNTANIFKCLCFSSWNLLIRPQVWGCKFLRGKWKWTFAVLAVCTNFGWFLLSWYLAMCPIFCCSIIQEVSFNNHQRNVMSRVSVSVSNFKVSVSAFMTKFRSRLQIWARSQSRSRLQIWARSQSRSRRLRSRLHHCLHLCWNALHSFLQMYF